MKKSGSKILGIAAAIAVIIYWGNSIFNKVEFSKLPNLKCIIDNPDGSRETHFYDLAKIEKRDPTKGMSSKEFTKYIKKRNLSEVTFSDSKSMYMLVYRNHENGIQKSYSVDIQKDTGQVEINVPTDTPVGSSLRVLAKAYQNGYTFKGECSKTKKKNL
jgi:hypothetical protein